MRREEQLLEAFYDAAMFLAWRVQNRGWQWSANYLREHVRCATGLQFSNTESPAILRALLNKHPELKPVIELGKLREPKGGDLFDRASR